MEDGLVGGIVQTYKEIHDECQRDGGNVSDHQRPPEFGRVFFHVGVGVCFFDVLFLFGC